MMRWRKRFAWLPVALFWIGPDGAKRVGTVWLRDIIEVYTLPKKWVAYRNHQTALAALDAAAK
jgi:hypothetical protein